MNNRQQFTRIRGLSDVRRLPRLGKIRLGIMREKLDDKGKVISSYPANVDYFVCPPEVQAIYGDRPKSLDIMFPLEDETVTFPQALKWYVAQGLRCKGDGERALRRRADLVAKLAPKRGDDPEVVDDARSRILEDPGDGDPNDLVEIGCPCPLLESGDCGESGVLLVILPRVSMGGVYQISTGSINNIIRINSCIDYVRGMIGRVAMVPLTLRRVAEQLPHEGKKRLQYLLIAELAADLREVVALRERNNLVLMRSAGLVLPAPIEDGPDPSPGGIVELTEEEEPERARRARVAQDTAAERETTSVLPEADEELPFDVKETEPEAAPPARPGKAAVAAPERSAPAPSAPKNGTSTNGLAVKIEDNAKRAGLFHNGLVDVGPWLASQLKIDDGGYTPADLAARPGVGPKAASLLFTAAQQKAGAR